MVKEIWHILLLATVCSPALAQTSYSFTPETCRFKDGPLIVEVRAYDEAGNIGVSQSVTLDVRNAPIPVIVYPRSGKLPRNQTVTITGSTSAVCDCTHQLSIDGNVVANAPCGSLSYDWGTFGLKGGHKIILQAQDIAGNVVSTQVNVRF